MVSDTVIITLVTSVQAVIVTVFGALIAIYQKRVAARADLGLKRLDALAEVTTSTHKLVNSWAIIQLRLLAAAHRRLATASNDVGDIRTAEDTEERLREEEKRQREVLK